jgi:hypothetical protein
VTWVHARHYSIWLRAAREAAFVRCICERGGSVRYVNASTLYVCAAYILHTNKGSAEGDLQILHDAWCERAEKTSATCVIFKMYFKFNLV